MAPYFFFLLILISISSFVLPSRVACFFFSFFFNFVERTKKVLFGRWVDEGRVGSLTEFLPSFYVFCLFFFTEFLLVSFVLKSLASTEDGSSWMAFLGYFDVESITGLLPSFTEFYRVLPSFTDCFYHFLSNQLVVCFS